MVDAVMAVPPSVRHLEELETCRYVSLFHLLRCRDLSLISVWSPTFLELMVEKLTIWGEQLAADVSLGRPRPPGTNLSAKGEPIARAGRPMPERGEEIRAALREPDAASMNARLWPKLSVVSAWADGPSESHAGRLAALYPQAVLEPKGLMATEGITSIPYCSPSEADAETGCVLALTSHFLEFLPANDDTALPAHRLDQGGCYEVVLTTGGGLYRYRTGDQIEVVGFFDQCPRVKFLGKTDQVSDFFGEKLSESHVRSVVTQAIDEIGLAVRFALVALEDGSPPAYSLHLEAPADEHDLDQIARIVEDGLLANPHYRYCRDLGQLGALTINQIYGNGWELYVARRCREGMREGDIKPAFLSQSIGWLKWFSENSRATPRNEDPR
jgi:hypothetical protein